MKENSEIIVIFNRYKDNLDDFIDSSNEKSLDWPGPIDKGSNNTPRFESSSIGFLKKYHLDKNVSDSLSQLMPKIEDF